MEREKIETKMIQNTTEPVTKCDQIDVHFVQSRIYTIRGEQVMIDYDLAEMYGVETKRLNEAVKRNIERFPERFMYKLTIEEWESLRSQIATINVEPSSLKSPNMISKNGRGQHSKYLPYAFTEQGITQLSTVLRSKTAIQVSIRIMDAFVAMRRFLSANAGMFQRIEKLEQHQQLTDQKVDLVLQRMDELAPTVTPEQIFASGCMWDAWDYVSQLVRSADKRIILIDNFVDERVLSLLTKRKKEVKATIYTRYSENFLVDLKKHNEQYPNIEFIQLPHKIHDRFLIIDQQVYLLGTSLKDMGHTLSAAILTGFTPEEILSKLV